MTSLRVVAPEPLRPSHADALNRSTRSQVAVHAMSPEHLTALPVREDQLTDDSSNRLPRARELCELVEDNF
jgi:hypothetical protein